MNLEDLGTLYPGPAEAKRGPMFLRHAVGEISDADGHAWEVSANVAGMHPIVRSKQTGRQFTLSWEEIVRLALARGIDGEDRP